MTSRTVKHSGRRDVVLVVVVICGLVSVADLTLAQTQEASIVGQVTDESGAVLPGVTVTASSPALQVKQMVDITNVRGEYRVTPLPLGTYVVEYTLPGFQTLRREGVRLTAGFVAKLDVVLKLGSVEESVTVSGQSPVVDVKTTSAATQVTRELLEAIPTGRNGLQSLMSLGAGVRPLLDYGNLSAEPLFRVFGRNGAPWVTIDGVAVTAPLTGQPNSGNRFNFDIFEEATIQTLGSAAESPTAGIQISVVTKSGGNDFHGGVSVAQFANWMQSNNIDDALRAQGITAPKNTTERWDRGGEFGGRFIRDKLWFYGSGRARVENITVLGVTLPDGSPVPNDLAQKMLSTKETFQMSSSQRLIGSYQWERLTKSGAGGINFTSFNDWDSRETVPLWSKTGKVEWQLAKGNKFLSLQSGFWSIPVGPYVGFSENPRTFDQVTLRVSGLSANTGRRNDNGRYDSKGTMNWYKPDLLHGNHDFKMGFNYGMARMNEGTIDRGAPGNIQLIFRNGVPFQIAARNNPATPDGRVNILAMFFQDSWAINRRVTLNLGIRYAHDRAFLPEQCRVTAAEPFATLYPEQCFPEVHLPDWNPVVPRIHLAYDLTGDGKTVIKGGWGRFATMHTADELTVFNENADLGTVFRWTDRNGDKRFQKGEADYSLNGPDFVQRQLSYGASLSGMVVNPDVKEAGSDEFSLSLERQLTANFGVRVTGLYSKNFNTQRIANTLRPYSAYNIPITNPDPGPDGRLGTTDDPGTFITYYDYPASLAGNAFQRPTFINDSGADANYKSVEIAASKRLANRWQLQASYSATKVHVPYIFDVFSGGGINTTSYNPNAEINAEQNTWDWTTRFGGSYTLPADIQASANYVAMSGDPWARTVSFTGGRQIPSITLPVEPIGTRRVPTQKLLTLRLDKSFRLRAGHRVGVRAQVFNVLNENFVTTNGSSIALVALNPQSGSTFGRPIVIANPRIAELGVTYAF